MGPGINILGLRGWEDTEVLFVDLSGNDISKLHK